MNREHLSLAYDLLGAQIVDAERRPLGRIEDLELELEEGGAPRVTTILTGLEALGQRVGGTLGRWAAGVAARLRPADEPGGPTRIDARHIEKVRPLVELDVRFAELPQVAGLERWLARNVVGRIPGSGDARD